MSEALEKLQSLGAQKISAKTHIPIQNIQALLHSNFDSFSRVQFLGFISILERDYGLDLAALKSAGVAHFDTTETTYVLEEGLFIVTNKKKKYILLSIGIALLALAVAAAVFFRGESTEDVKVDDALIEHVQKTIKPTIEEANVTMPPLKELEQKAAQVIEQEPEQVVETKSVQEPRQEPLQEAQPPAPQSLKLVSKSKVWFGYIDLATHKKHQKNFSGEIVLDPQKDWLLRFGHGRVDIFVDAKQANLHSRTHTRFLYEDGLLRAITAKEFKEKNRGNTW